jgi:hypothetical protein
VWYLAKPSDLFYGCFINFIIAKFGNSCSLNTYKPVTFSQYSRISLRTLEHICFNKRTVGNIYILRRGRYVGYSLPVRFPEKSFCSIKILLSVTESQPLLLSVLPSNNLLSGPVRPTSSGCYCLYLVINRESV